MIAVLGSFCLALAAALATLGYGSVIARLLKIRPDIGARGLLGLFGLAFLGSVLHFSVALSLPVQAAALTVGVAAAIFFWRRIVAEAGLAPAWIAVLFLFVLLRQQAILTYDTGLYYLQTFKWNSEFPIVAGLGNLHGRLAFNSILFVIAPLTDRIQVGWITNFLIAMFVFLSLWALLKRIDLSHPDFSVVFWFLTLAIFFLAAFGDRVRWTGVLLSDSAALVLIVYCIVLALAWLSGLETGYTLPVLVLLASLATACKLSAAPLLGLALAIGWLSRKHLTQHAGLAWVLAALLLVVWAVRGILLSGCAVYPVRQTCLQTLAWSVPPQEVQDEADFIRSWARAPGDVDFGRVLRDWSWLGRWLDIPINRAALVALAIACILGLVAIAIGRIAKGAAARRQAIAVITGALAAGLAYWFLAAPSVRFGSGFILATLLFGSSLAAAAWLYGPKLGHRLRLGLFPLILICTLPGLVRLRARSFIADLPEATVYDFSGVVAARLWVTHHGSQCWSHTLPCTPYVTPSVGSRVHLPPPSNSPAGPSPPTGWVPPQGVYAARKSF